MYFSKPEKMCRFIDDRNMRNEGNSRIKTDTYVGCSILFIYPIGEEETAIFSIRKGWK